MGGLFKIPHTNKNPMLNFADFMSELIVLPGVKEIFEKYGVVWKTNQSD